MIFKTKHQCKLVVPLGILIIFINIMLTMEFPSIAGPMGIFAGIICSIIAIAIIENKDLK